MKSSSQEQCKQWPLKWTTSWPIKSQTNRLHNGNCGIASVDKYPIAPTWSASLPGQQTESNSTDVLTIVNREMDVRSSLAAIFFKLLKVQLWNRYSHCLIHRKTVIYNEESPCHKRCLVDCCKPYNILLRPTLSNDSLIFCKYLYSLHLKKTTFTIALLMSSIHWKQEPLWRRCVTISIRCLKKLLLPGSLI